MDDCIKNVLAKSFHTGPSAMIVVRERDRCVMAVNKSFSKTFGYAPEDIVGRDIHEVNFWISPEARQSMVRALTGGRKVREQDHPFNTRDGRTLIVSYSARMIEQDGDRYVYAVMNDITARRQAERRLRDNEMALRVMLDASIGTALLMSRQGIVIACNTRLGEVFAQSREAMIGRPIREFVDGESYAALMQHLNSVAENRKAITIEMAFVGEWLKFQIAPIMLGSDGAHILDMPLLPIARSVIHRRTGNSRPLSKRKQEVTAFAICAVNLSEQRRLAAEREQLISDLQKALSEVKTLRGLLPVCSHCKKIRNDDGDWQAMEEYVGHHSEACFSHGVCPECMQRYYAADLAARRARMASKRTQ